MPDAPRFPYRSRERLLEVPISTVRAFNRNWPAGGGGFFRLLPYAVSRRALQRVNRVDQRAAIFYFHPWEIDPQQPRVPGLDFKTRFRHYVNLHRTEHGCAACCRISAGGGSTKCSCGTRDRVVCAGFVGCAMRTA